MDPKKTGSIACDITDVLKASRFLKGRVRHTPLERSYPLSERVGADVFVKWENQQLCGAFKIRGALNKLFSLSDAERARGVVTASSGNHAQAVAMGASLLGIRAVICVPGYCPETKKQMVRRRGGEWVDLRVIGHAYDEAEVEALRLAREEGLVFVSAYEDRLIAAGQGSLAVEMLFDEPELDTIICPISGGGLITGVVTAAAALHPGIRVWGAHARNNPGWTEGWKAGRIVPVEELDSIADALGGAASQPLFEYLHGRLAGVVDVSEDEIERAIAFMHREHHQVVEGGGAVAVAALLAGRVETAGHRIGIVVSGGNIADEKLLPICEKYLKSGV